MDDPGLDHSHHIQALAGLARLNWWSRSAAHLWQPIRELAHRQDLASLSVLDVACGAGDNLARIVNLANRDGVKLSVTGCDISSTALNHAQNRFEQSANSIRWIEHDAIQSDFCDESDVVICSLFIHHLSARDQRILLTRMRSAARRLVVVSDLVRSRWGATLAFIGSRTLTRSPIVHTDACRSVAASLTIQEARQALDDAGMQSARLHRCWPARWRAVWERGQP